MRRILVLLILLDILVVVVLLWPVPSYDISRVHPSLRELAAPYRSVRTAYFLDGGSIAVTIVDRDARKLELALPVFWDGLARYPHLFVGNLFSRRPRAVQVPFSEDTRRMLISVIEASRTPGDDGDIALRSLRGSPRDYARFAAKMATEFLFGSGI